MTRTTFLCATTLAATILLLIGPPITAQSSGTRGGYSGAPGERNCTNCHSGTVNSGPATLAIQTPDSTVGGGNLSVQLAFANSSSATHGFEMTARDHTGSAVGTWVITDSTNTQRTGSAHVTHTRSGNGRSSWNMDLTVPGNAPAGPITLYAAGLEGNGGSTSGDRTYTTSRTVYQAGITTAATTWPLGSTQTLDLAAPQHGGEYFVLVISNGTTPTSVGSFDLPVTVANPFFDLVLQGFPFFQNFYGVLDNAGTAQSAVIVPPIAFLSGFTWHFAFASFDQNFNATEVSHRVSVTLQ
ncbi:MAG: hypothetical protein H6834_14360 [Planctomycetes bacterium]|nr:hypothetical protein [Planctomycetota bacterium]MCB9891934.1 hypothetical protein [Planctomycetota bacterium]